MGHGPGCELAVTVFAEDIRMHVVDIDATLPAEKMSETDAVENCARSDHPASFVSRTPGGNMGQNVNGIAHYEYHACTSLDDDVIDNAANDGRVLVEKLEPGFTGSLRGTCRDDDYLLACLPYVPWPPQTQHVLDQGEG
jgi:hypothetical protein